MKSIKLVRDKIPDIMKSEGKNPTFYAADEKEFCNLLKNKLQEEVNEYVKDDAVEELCDILEVIHAICASKKMDMNDLEQIRLKKINERGAFVSRFVLELTK